MYILRLAACIIGKSRSIVQPVCINDSMFDEYFLTEKPGLLQSEYFYQQRNQEMDARLKQIQQGLDKIQTLRIQRRAR